MDLYQWALDLISVLWLPLLLMAAAVFALNRVRKAGTNNASKEAMGIALGVVLGFISQVTVSSFEEFRKEQLLKRAAIRLLREDAKSVYRTMWLMDGLVKRGYRPVAPLKMQYWDTLKKDQRFLMLAQDPKFADIFKDFFDFEVINQVVTEGRAGKKDSETIGRAIFLTALQEGAHKKFLLKFMTQAEIDEFDLKHKNERATVSSER